VPNRILTRGNVVTAFVYARGKSRAECSCGYEGRRRFIRTAAVNDALIHSARTGCQADSPLVVDERAVGASWFQKVTPWPVLAWSPLLLIAAAPIRRW
jgi:hypothetical protein